MVAGAARIATTIRIVLLMVAHQAGCRSNQLHMSAAHSQEWQFKPLASCIAALAIVQTTQSVETFVSSSAVPPRQNALVEAHPAAAVAPVCRKGPHTAAAAWRILPYLTIS